MTFEEERRTIRINPDFKPRWYQEEASNAIFNYFYEGNTGHPLIVAPTGAGKSHIIALFCKRVLEQWPHQRILILSHVDTILRQDYFALLEHIDMAKVGMYSAGVGIKERRAVTVAGIQSIHNKYGLFNESTLILIDEAHTVPPKGEGQYRKFLSKFKCPIVGLTATHFRLGTGYLHEGAGRIFTDIAYSIDINRLIDEGFLCSLIPREPSVTIDMEGVHTQGGDFAKKEVAERLDREGITTRIIDDLSKYKDTHKQWLIFAIDIDHAELTSYMLNEIGVETAVVHSKQPKVLNEALKREYKDGRYQALVSVESLTTGFDVPSIDLIALLRPTKSPVLHIQMIGRGLRIYPGKEHCLVLDYAGNVSRLGPINDVQVLKKKKSKGGEPITKTCPECKRIVAGVVKICPECGFVFIFVEKLQLSSANKEIVRKKKKEVGKPTWVNVDGVTYKEYSGQYGSTMLVSYRCGIRTFFEYKNIGSNSKAGYNSQYWWSQRTLTPMEQLPYSPAEGVMRAQSGELKVPKSILVSERGKYPDIQDYIF